MKYLILLCLLTTGCPQKGYRGFFHNVTSCKYDKKSSDYTPSGVRVYGVLKHLYNAIDEQVNELELCLNTAGVLDGKIRRDWFGVMFPPDWYISECTGEQMIPSRISYRLCERKPGVKIPEACRGIHKPTATCRCPCNVRSAIQDSWLIVTTPNMKLFKAELARLVLWPRHNNPWKDSRVSRCL